MKKKKKKTLLELETKLMKHVGRYIEAYNITYVLTGPIRLRQEGKDKKSPYWSLVIDFIGEPRP